jgi:hypothetical protein
MKHITRKGYAEITTDGSNIFKVDDKILTQWTCPECKEVIIGSNFHKCPIPIQLSPYSMVNMDELNNRILNIEKTLQKILDILCK